PINTSVPTLQEQLHEAGYLNGILGKVTHLAPREKFKWGMVQDFKELGNGRNPRLYYKYARSFFDQAADQGKPFFVMANSHDPHRQYPGSVPCVRTRGN
ncbi:MAG: sulfatase family protein, partial [Planctomycetota bacterium]